MDKAVKNTICVFAILCFIGGYVLFPEPKNIIVVFFMIIALIAGMAIKEDEQLEYQTKLDRLKKYLTKNK